MIILNQLCLSYFSMPVMMVIQVCLKRSKMGGGTWMWWGARIVLRQCSETKETCCPFLPFLVCVMFHEDLRCKTKILSMEGREGERRSLMT